MPAAPAEAAPQGTEHVVEETIRDLKTIPGFQSYLILNNDGIVIKYENMSYRTALQVRQQNTSATYLTHLTMKLSPSGCAQRNANS
jgi:hypothetical protein